MKKSKITHLLSFVLCMALLFATNTSAAAAEVTKTAPTTSKSVASESPVPPELPTSVGFCIGTLNQYELEYSECYFDEDLGSMVLVFRPSTASKLQALLSYCTPAYRLAEELDEIKAASTRVKGPEEPNLLTLMKMLNELTLNAGGGRDYRYAEFFDLIKAAEKEVATEGFGKFVKATEPLRGLEKADASELHAAFSEEELAALYSDIREAAYGEWALRITWLDEMEFTFPVPVSGPTGNSRNLFTK